MIKDAGCKFNDYSVSPKIRQIFSEYYLQNKEAIKEKSKNQYRNLSNKEKDKIKEYQRKRYQQLIQYKKEALQN